MVDTVGLEVVDSVVPWEFVDDVGLEVVGAVVDPELHWTLAGQSQYFSSSFQSVPEGHVSS